MDNISSSEIASTLSYAFKSLDVESEGEIPVTELVSCIRTHVETQTLDIVKRKSSHGRSLDLQLKIENTKNSLLRSVGPDDKGALVTIKKPGTNQGAIGNVHRVVNSAAYVQIHDGQSKRVVGPIDIKHLEKSETSSSNFADARLRVQKAVGETIHDWMLHSDHEDLRKEAPKFFTAYFTAGDRIARAADADGNGFISEDEFLMAFMTVYNETKGKRDILKSSASTPLKQYERVHNSLLKYKGSEKLSLDGIMMDKGGKPAGELTVNIIRASKLSPMNFEENANPYVSVSMPPGANGEEFLGGSKDSPVEKKTRVVQDNLSPMWNTKFVFTPLRKRGGVVIFKVFDNDTVMNDELIGEVSVNIASILPSEEEDASDMKRLTLELMNEGSVRGELTVEFRVCYSKINFYSRQLQSMQEKKNALISQIIEAENALWLLISPFRNLSNMYTDAHPEKETGVEFHAEEAHESYQPTGSDTTLELPNLPVFKLPKVVLVAKFFFCGFSIFSFLMLLLGLILNGGGENTYAKIFPGEP